MVGWASVSTAGRALGSLSVGSAGGGSFQDPEDARTIHLAAGGLVLLAIALAIGTVWWWRTSKTEHPALGPLEEMGARSWWRSDYAERRRRLDEARPAGAEIPDAHLAAAAEQVDLQALVRSVPTHYDDLLDDDAAAAKAAARAAAAEAEADAVVLVEVAVSSHVANEPGATASPAAAEEPTRHDGISAPDVSPSSGIPIDPLLRMQSAD